MARIDVRNMPEGLKIKAQEQTTKLGLSSVSDYIRLIIELDASTGLIEILREKKDSK